MKTTPVVTSHMPASEPKPGHSQKAPQQAKQPAFKQAKGSPSQGEKLPKREPRLGRKPLRIIAGTWRGRRMPMLALDEVRPTMDRIRETLFNWLQPVIAGAYCLDTFAGTGILGLEALSRGAASVMFVDKQAALCKHIQGFLKLVDCHQGKVFCQSLPNDKIISHITKPFDLVFLDPPYQQDLWIPVLNWLTTHQLVHDQRDRKSVV
jgi:16S rRNA (guanine966-N2)-methyltransferase